LASDVFSSLPFGLRLSLSVAQNPFGSRRSLAHFSGQKLFYPPTARTPPVHPPPFVEPTFPLSIPLPIMLHRTFFCFLNVRIFHAGSRLFRTPITAPFFVVFFFFFWAVVLLFLPYHVTLRLQLRRMLSTLVLLFTRWLAQGRPEAQRPPAIKLPVPFTQEIVFFFFFCPLIWILISCCAGLVPFPLSTFCRWGTQCRSSVRNCWFYRCPLNSSD